MSRNHPASLRQLAASAPTSSTWLSANAGSGKTKVLTDRVARLLLDGVPPEKILCLTFTKAAAAEMQNRLFVTLGEWAMLGDADLRDKLEGFVDGAALDEARLDQARTLFACAVETPGGLKIQTIHSFCSALLRRFPLEAGVSPQFREMDAMMTRRLVDETLDEMARGAERDAIDAVAVHLGGGDPYALCNAVIAEREAFGAPVSGDEIRSWFGLPQGYGEVDILASVFRGGEGEMLREAAGVFATSAAKTDVANGDLLRDWAGREPSMSLLGAMMPKLVFDGTSKTAPFQTKFGRGFPNKKIAEAAAEPLGDLEDFMLRVEEARESLLAFQDAQKTMALHKFAQGFLPRFLEKKAALGVLDFDDMIVKTRDLIATSSVAEWVLYRLDGGINHILVDEAQDTSPDQWKVVEHLAAEFTAGKGAREDEKRTLFVVGDRKQSIYSFQGAAPDAFDDMKALFSERFSGAGEPFQDLALEHSFRSSQAILSVTDAVFEACGGTGVGPMFHEAFFEATPGRVDLWDSIEAVKPEKGESDWEFAPDQVGDEHHTSQLARRVADFVAEVLETGSVPRKRESESTAVAPGDILILVRKRSGLFAPLLRALKAHPKGIPVAGADRMDLSDELAVQDIKSLLAFLSLQDDDLALAEVLRSPLFGWSEQDLYTLAHERRAVSLWQELRAQRGDWPDTMAVIDDLRMQADYLRPYELIQRALIRHGGRRKFVARLGGECEDGIDALLQQAQVYERTETPSLTGFVSWLETQDIEIKRVLDEGSNLVRVMTVHGAKGLEAPIVILPDTMRDTRESKDDFVDLDEGKIAWRTSKAERSEALAQATAKIAAQDEEEENRLLYVAMTRAKNWLVVGGAGDKEKHWYEQVRVGLEAVGAAPHEFGFCGGLRHSFGDWPARRGGEVPEAGSSAGLEPWCRDVVAAVTVPKEVVLSPSDLGGAKALAGEIGGEAGEDAEAAMRRGRQIHLLIEHLPAHRRDTWGAVARHVLAMAEEPALGDELESLLPEVTRVIDARYEWPVFGAGGLAEVPFSARIDALGGALRGAMVSGIIDRLIVTETCVRIVDYKSNRVVPDRVEDIPLGILRQLGAYAEACRLIFPGRAIETAVLWTATAELCPVPLDIVMSALAQPTTS
ncbi:double-strand break repair helicase AddA [Celeribacter arenosi]|uniref:DNA 3'-5' helicase n=1 Tax=Celeribacter arenosi TaxID=792649 RepID=A0ABP7JZL1_9RHOB